MKKNSQPEGAASQFMRTFFRVFFCTLSCACVIAAVFVGIFYGIGYCMILVAGAILFAMLMILAKEQAEKKEAPKTDFMNTEEENAEIRDSQDKEE